MSDIEYSDLLFEISRKLDAEELQRLLFMCRNAIAKGSKRNIQDVLTLFEELERNNHLGIDRLDTLKGILTQMKKRSLLKKVEEFEIRRKAQSVGIVSSLKRAATCIKGAIKMVCNFRTIAGGLLVVTSGMALRSCCSLDEFVEVFNKVVLVSYSKLVEISEGSLCFTVQAGTSSALKGLWDMYKGGTLQHRLQEFLVTDEIKQLASGEDIEVTVYIDEQEYKAAYLDLMLLQLKEASDATEEERLGARRRSHRNSDSFLCLKRNEDDMTLMKLEQAENKLAFQRQFLEEENKKLRTEIAVVGNVQRRLFWQQEEGGTSQETEDLERPRERRRRNSDSTLYCNSRAQVIAQSEGGAEAKHLDSEKYERQRQNMTDSGITTHGESSDLEMQEISDYPFQLCLKDLRGDVTQELDVRLAGDKDVLQALQLYDLVDLLQKLRPVRSLRPVLPTGPRPNTYHSIVAVLIIADESHRTEGIERFFKGLSSKSDVTVVKWRTEQGKLLSSLQVSRPWEREIQKESETFASDLPEVIERWIRHQGYFSLFAVFVSVAEYVFLHEAEPWIAILEESIERLVFGIPDKIKFLMWPAHSILVPYSSESFVVVTPPDHSRTMLESVSGILNERWQTLDLISMIEEYKRSVYKWRSVERVLIKDRLSSRPRFKKE